MKLSIIVVTTDRLVLISRLFASLAAQTCKDFDVVFVHGPAVPEATVRSLLACFPGLPVTALQSRDVCVSRSRNLGIPAAAGDILAFADDDCAYEPDTVAAVLAAFAEHAAPGLIMASALGFDEKIPERPRRGTRLNAYSVFYACPTFVQFYRADVVAAIGTFDESIGPGSGSPYSGGEETDYALRALAAGFSAVRAPRALVRHPRTPLRSQGLAAKTAGYAAGRMHLLHRHAFPWWFRLANVLYPLLRLPLDCLEECLLVGRYRWIMFRARLRWLTRAQ